jgi:hypothetical protein
LRKRARSPRYIAHQDRLSLYEICRCVGIEQGRAHIITHLLGTAFIAFQTSIQLDVPGLTFPNLLGLENTEMSLSLKVFRIRNLSTENNWLLDKALSVG